MLAGLCALVLDGADPGASAAQTSDPGFIVRNAQTRLVDGVYLLDASIDFVFSGESLEAMENGVPLTVLFEMEVRRERRLVDKRIAKVAARYRVETHALSEQYVIKNLSSGEARTFRSFDEMTVALGHITEFPLLDSHLLDDTHRYKVRMRAKLDIEALPSPMRPLAYLSPVWRLTSDWYEWPIER